MAEGIYKGAGNRAPSTIRSQRSGPQAERNGVVSSTSRAIRRATPSVCRAIRRNVS
jgi:hypothetical protein